MRKTYRNVAGFLAAFVIPKYVVIIIILLAGIFIATCSDKKQADEKTTILLSKHARPLTDIKFASSPGRIKRGEYLAVGILRCFTCHSPVDTTLAGRPPIKGKEGSGALFFEKDSFHLYAPNITADKETGAGNWSDDMLQRAIREGIGHDGRRLHSGMPYHTFCHLSDEDLASLIVYLRTIPAIKNKLPQRHLSVATERRLQNEEIPKNMFAGHPDLSTQLSKGRYLVTIGECEGCHTGWYARNPGVFGGGNIIHYSFSDSVTSPNITADGTGIGTWDDPTFIRMIRTGKVGRLKWVMPWIAYRNMTDEDLTAMFSALKTITPVQHRVINDMPPTYCEVCGQKHGYGENNKLVTLKPYETNTASWPAYAGTYVSKIYGDTTVITYKDKKLWLSFQGDKPASLVPVAAATFAADGFLAPVSFEKDQPGKKDILVLHDLVLDSSMKVK